MFVVKERYQDDWFGNQTPEPLTAEEVERLADCWGLTPEDLEEQLETGDDLNRICCKGRLDT